MINLSRFVAIALIAFAAFISFSVAAFYYRPVARVFALRLDDADLRRADLAGRNLAWAALRRADLGGAILDGADLRGADLTGIVGLTREQLRAARVDDWTTLPPEFRTPDVLDADPHDFRLTRFSVPLKFVPNKVAVASDGSTLAVVGETDEVRLWSIGESGLAALASLPGLGGHGRSVCFHPADAQVLAVGSDDGSIRLWRLGEPAPFRRLGEAKEGYVFNLRFGAGGRTLASASKDEASGEKTIHVWDVAASGEAEAAAGVGPSELIADLSPEQRSMAIAGGGTTGGAPQQLLTGASLGAWRIELAAGDVTVGAYSRDGRLLAVGKRQGSGEEFPRGSVSIWRAEEGRLLPGPPDAPTAYPVSLDFSADGRLLLTGWSDGSISLWQVEPARRLMTFAGHSAEVSNVAFTPDWRVFASVGSDRLLRLWRVVQD